MKKRLKILFFATCLLTSLTGMSIRAQQDDLPLSGPALVLADKAYAAFARGDYLLAAQQAREARRLRPDVKRLNALIDKAQAALAASRRPGIRSPIALSKPKSELVLTSPTGAPTVASTVAPTIAPATADPAFVAADAGYRAYERGDFTMAVLHAQQAVKLAPTRRDYWILLINALSAADRLAEAEQANAQAVTQAGDDGGFAILREALRVRIAQARAFELGTAAYKAFDEKNYAQAARDMQSALEQTPNNREYQLLLVNALFRAEQFVEAERSADIALATNNDARLLVQRGIIRKRLGKDALASADFATAVRNGGLPVVIEIGLLADGARMPEARKRFQDANNGAAFVGVPAVEVAYLAARVGDDTAAIAAFARADAEGKLPTSASQDAAYAAMRSSRDDDAILYFKRSIDDANALKLRIDPQLLFNTRRAVSDVSRETGVIASLAYRNAVPGLGVTPRVGNNLQAGIEAFWRPWGYRNGRYPEVFVRAFQTIRSNNGGAVGTQTQQSAVGIRYKPFSQVNVVTSISRVFRPSGARDDWLAQLGYSGDNGSDLRVDVPAWWTTRAFAEAGHYLSAGQSYALVHAEAGRSIKLGSGAGKWVLFPHLSVAADYDSTLAEPAALGIGPGVGARFWFREDVHAAPRSYLDLMLGYRARVGGADRAQGMFLTTTLVY